ncbi:MAG: DUF4328 domain-containing protein [Armatimonadota bacterium]|nr:DUF4328 domain-containing protein [Armatimonadota bacterium]
MSSILWALLWLRCRSVSRATVVLLVVYILLCAVAIMYGWSLINMLSSLDAFALRDTTTDSGEKMAIAEAMARQATLNNVLGLQFLAYLCASVFFLVWIHRAHQNLSAFDMQGLSYSPAWAVGWFFVPILNLFQPYHVAVEIWKASDPRLGNDRHWQTARSSWLIGCWWVLFVLMNVAHGISSKLSDASSAIWGLVISEILGIAAAILAVLLVRAIDSRQEQRSRGLATGDTTSESGRSRGI